MIYGYAKEKYFLYLSLLDYSFIKPLSITSFQINTALHLKNIPNFFFKVPNI